MANYQVTATRSDGWWAIEVPDLATVHSRARRLDQIAPMAIEAIALALGVDEDDIDVEVVPDPQHEAAAVLDVWRAGRASLRRANSDAAASTQQTVQFLRWDGFSMRDIASLMGMSFQRVHQILNEAPPTCPVCDAPGVWDESTRISHGSIHDKEPSPPKEVQVLVARCSVDPAHWRFEGPSFDEAESSPRPPLPAMP